MKVDPLQPYLFMKMIGLHFRAYGVPRSRPTDFKRAPEFQADRKMGVDVSSLPCFLECARSLEQKLQWDSELVMFLTVLDSVEIKLLAPGA